MYHVEVEERSGSRRLDIDRQSMMDGLFCFPQEKSRGRERRATTHICTKSSPQHAPLDLRFHPVDSGHLGSKDHGVVLRGRFDIVVREC